MLASTAAHELGRLGLADALALTLLYRDKDPSRYDRAAVRWHARFCAETSQLAPVDSQLALAALGALVGPRPETGARALIALFDALVLPEPAAVVEEWLARRPAA